MPSSTALPDEYGEGWGAFAGKASGSEPTRGDLGGGPRANGTEIQIINPPPSGLAGYEGGMAQGQEPCWGRNWLGHPDWPPICYPDGAIFTARPPGSVVIAGFTDSWRDAQLVLHKSGVRRTLSRRACRLAAH